MERLTKHDSDIGYYVGVELVDEYYTSNVDGHGITQGEAITRLAELENMIEAVGELGDECDVRTWVNLQDTIEAELRLRMEGKR